MERQATGQNHQVAVVILPQAINGFCHELKHSARALEAVDGCPGLIKLSEDLGMDGIALEHSLVVAGLLCLLWQFCAFGNIGIRKRPADLVPCFGIASCFKKSSSHDFKRLLRCHGFPERLHTVENGLQ